MRIRCQHFFIKINILFNKPAKNHRFTFGKLFFTDFTTHNMRIILLVLISFLFSCTQKQKLAEPKLPNIVYILADDLGYGDVSIYNPESKIATPHIDKLAGQGMRFTDAHSPSSVCTPTRYAILTGRYPWRTRLPRGVLQGYGQALIEQEETTVAELLRSKGYTTGVVGKWHLGLDWKVKNGYEDSLKFHGDLPILTTINSDWIDFSATSRLRALNPRI
jgi:arylsulfatase A